MVVAERPRGCCGGGAACACTAAAARAVSRGQELRHARVVLGDPLLELELEARLLGHAVVELRPAVADHVADHDADEEAAEDRGEAEVRGIGQAARRGLSGTEPTAAPAIAPIATPSLPTARAFAW